jgi:hypothetical protein
MSGLAWRRRRPGRDDLLADPLSLALLRAGWSSLDRAYGRAVGYLDAAMLHPGGVFSATAPFIKIVAMLLADPGTAVPVADILPRDPAQAAAGGPCWTIWPCSRNHAS